MPRFAAVLALALLCAAFGGAPVSAQSDFGPTASLTDLRVGVHPDKTRIVIETDSQAPYVMEPSDDEVVIRVDAAAAAEAVTAKSPDLIWVKVEPSPDGTAVRIQLKRPVDVKPMVLTRPDRIVLDLSARAEPAEATPLPAPVVLPEEEPAPVVVAESDPEPIVIAESEPDLTAEPEPEFAPVPVEDLDLIEPEEPIAFEPESEFIEEELGEAAPDMEFAEEEFGAEPVAGFDEDETAPEQAGSPTTPAAPAPSARPYLFGATAIVLMVVFVWLNRRLRADKKTAIPEFPEEDESSPFETPERVVSVTEEAGTGESVFDVEPDSLEPEAEEVPSLRPPLPEAEPVDEDDRRIVHLEKRVEELSEAKDRLERQIAAQTEELRVQRAAIARTQRVLRSIAPKGDEEPSEPLARG
jgi:hypothetical protein